MLFLRRKIQGEDMKHSIAHWIDDNKATASQMLSEFLSKDIGVDWIEISSLHRQGYLRRVARLSQGRSRWIGTAKLRRAIHE